MDEDVAPGCSVALAIGGRMERRAWDGATTSDRDYDGGAMGRKRARRGVRATRVGWMVLMMVVVCAFMGVGDARGSENATEARRKDKKYRARHQGVDAVLKQMKNLVERQKFWIGESSRCENVKFSVGKVPEGGSVNISLKGASHLQREYELREGGVERACLDLSEPNELVVSTRNITDKNTHATLTVEKGDGELLLMKQIDGDGRELGVSYSKMTIAPESSKVTALLAKRFGPECEDVVFDTAFATDSGVSRDMTHRLYDGNGDLLSQWVRHASGEKNMCLLRGQTYKLKLEGSMSHGNTEQRVAVRVTGADELDDGFAYSGTSSEALAQDDEFTYFASGDETKDSMILHGRYSFHIPNPCGPKEAQLSVVLTASTFGDGVPPSGMSWVINDSHGKEVMAMSKPFKRGEYGVTRFESRCVPEGNYTLVASATDKRGWKFGPVLNIYQTSRGQKRTLLVSEGAVRKKGKHTYEKPWFSSGLVSKPLEFCVNSTDVSHVDGKVERIASLASLGIERVAPQAGVWQVSPITFVFGTIAVIAMMASGSSARDDEIEVRASLVKGSGSSAYGTGAPGPLDDDVSDSRPRKGKAKRVGSRVSVMRMLAVGSTLLAVVSMYQTDDGEVASLGEAANSQHSRQAFCGMGQEKCDMLTAPDCKSKFMYTYRKGKLAHTPAFLLPYSSKVANGESYSVDVRFDPMECAQNGMETCDDLGEVQQQSLNGCSLACRETDACESFSLEDTRCRLCTTERLNAGGNSSVSSVARCMKPFKFAFKAISVDQCAKACDKTTLCHGFNYFEKSAGGESHCSLLRAPTNFNAHIWRESAKTKSGIVGAATYYKTPLSDYKCTARGKSVKLPALPSLLKPSEPNEHVSGRTSDRHYPDSDHNYPDAQDEDTDDKPSDETPRKSDVQEVPITRADDKPSDETPRKSDVQEVPITRVPHFVVTSSMQLDGVTPSAFEKSDALRAAFRRGLAMMLHIKEEDVLFLDITPNTDEDGQAMKDGVHVSFSVLRTSKEEANAAVVVLRSLTEENNQAGVPNARLRNHLKDAGLHANSATVIEPPTITEPSEDLRGTSYDNLVTNRTIYAPPPMRVPKVPKKEEGSYFVLRSAMSIVGYSAAEFGKKESSQFLRGIRTFFVIGKADATVLLVKDAPESTSKNPVVNVQFQLVEHDRMKATLTLQVFILMKDRTTAQLANLAHVFKFKGLKKVTSCFIHGEPSVEMRKHQPPPPPAPPMPPSPPPKMLNIERNVTKNVEIISSKLKFKTTSSVESFDETRKDAVRAVLASFISSRVGSTVPSDSIRIISIKMNGVVKYFDLGMSTNTSHVAAALGATESPAEIDYEVTVTKDEDEEMDVGNAINSLLNEVSDDTSSSQTQSHPSYPAYPSDATGYPDGYPGANTTSPNENYPSSTNTTTNTTSGTGGLSSELMESLNRVGLEMTELLPAPPTNVTETVIEETVVITVPAPHPPPSPPAPPAEEYPGDEEYPGGVNFMTAINSTSPEPGSTSPEPGSTSQDYPSTTPSSTEPESTSPEPGSTSPEPGSTSPEPGSTSPEPGSTSPEPGSTSPEPGSTSPEPGSTSPEPGSTSPEPGSTSPEPGSTSPEPGSTSPEPGSTSPEPGSTSPEPGSTSPEPGSTSPEPGSTSPEPGSTSPEPGSTSPEPGSTSPEPGSTSPEPGSTSPEPGSTSPEPGSTSPEPGSTSPEPGSTSQDYPSTTPSTSQDYPSTTPSSTEPGSTSQYYPSSNNEPGSTSPEPGSTSQYYPSSNNEPGSTSTVPGSTSQYYPSSNNEPGSTSTVPGSTSQYYPSSNNEPGSTSTVPGSTSQYYPSSNNEPGSTSTVPGSTSQYYPSSNNEPGSTSTVPGSTSQYYPSSNNEPGSTSTVPGSTSQYYPSSNNEPGSTSTVPGSTSQYYPSTTPSSTEPASTKPSSSTHYPFTPSSGPEETQEPVPGEESTEPSPTPTEHYPFTPSSGPEETQEPVPGEESTEPSPTPTEHYPFTPSSGPVQTPDDVGPEETSEVVPGDSATPTPTPTISPSDDSNATMLHEVRAGVRLFGYVATSFDSEERGFFRRGMSTFLGIAPKQITINHVEDVNTRSTRRLLQASAVDVYYVVSTTTPQVASAVVDETNRALNTTGSGALLSSLQSAGLVISQVVIISRPNVTVVPMPPTPAPAPSSTPSATPFNLSDININLNVDVTVHMDESNLSPPANATGRSTTNDPGTNASPTPTPTPGIPNPDADADAGIPNPDAGVPGADSGLRPARHRDGGVPIRARRLVATRSPSTGSRFRSRQRLADAQREHVCARQSLQRTAHAMLRRVGMATG